jgi:hypothetical protein
MRRATVCSLFLGVLALAGCEKNEATSPTPVATPAPTPTPTPAPSGPTFSVSGTISQTAPRATTRVPEAEVQLTGGVATGSVADGTFTIPNVANGSYTLRIAKAGFETQTVPVTVSGGNVSGLQVSLMPVFRLVDEEYFRSLGSGGPSCPGTSRPCHSYPVQSHHGGDIRAFAAWNSNQTDFDMEFWCGNVRVERRGQQNADHDEILPRIQPGQSCDIRVVWVSGPTINYTLYLTYPY